MHEFDISVEVLQVKTCITGKILFIFELTPFDAITRKVSHLVLQWKICHKFFSHIVLLLRMEYLMLSFSPALYHARMIMSNTYYLSSEMHWKHCLIFPDQKENSRSVGRQYRQAWRHSAPPFSASIFCFANVPKTMQGAYHKKGSSGKEKHFQKFFSGMRQKRLTKRRFSG